MFPSFEGDLEKVDGASRVAPKSGKGRFTADGPILSPNVISLNWVTNTGGQSSTPPPLQRAIESSSIR